MENWNITLERRTCPYRTDASFEANNNGKYCCYRPDGKTGNCHENECPIRQR